MRSRSLPMPSMRAPIATRQSARSVISGSRAALISTVSPSASVAAISRFSVAPTETDGKDDFGAVQPFGRARIDIAFVQLDLGAEPAQAP